LFAAAIPSCGEDTKGRVALHPASGQVLFRGQPLADVQVVFRPAGPEKPGLAPVPIGRTDPEGKFRLTTSVGDVGSLPEGAPAGDYLVGISTPRPSDSVDFLRKDAPKATPDVLRGRYADPGTSGLKATIKPRPNALEPFDLK